jgi:streptogramin lyase
MRNACFLHLCCVGLAACALATACGSTRAKPVTIHANSLALVDAKSNALIADVSVLRIDPRTLRTTATIRDATTTIEGSEPKLAFANGSVWISSPAESNVARIDPRRETVEKQPLVEAMGISAGAGAVWVADNANSVWRFGGLQPQRIKVGSQPQDVAATSTAVWVADSGDQTLVRLDPASRRPVARIKLHHRPIAVAAGVGVVAAVIASVTP